MLIIIPYTIAYVIIITIKLITGTDYTIQQLMDLYVTGSAGPGGYFIIVYLQVILAFPIIYKIVAGKKFKGVLLCIGINILFEMIVWIISQRGIDIYAFYRLCFIRYLSAIAGGVYLHFEDREHKALKFGMFVMGILYIVDYAYLGWTIPAVTYWPHSSFYTTLFIFPVVSWLIKRENCSENKIENLLSLIGKNSFYICLVQMDFFTNRYSLHIGNLSIWSMCAIALVLCTCVGILYGIVCRRVLQIIKV